MTCLYHPPAADGLRVRMQPWATQMAARFGHPVYLVGSALVLPEPRDVDVRIVIPDDDFAARYGSAEKVVREASGEISPEWRRWASDLAKLSSQGVMELRVNLDLQIESPSWARRHLGKRRVRLDATEIPDWFGEYERLLLDLGDEAEERRRNGARAQQLARAGWRAGDEEASP